MLSERRPEGRTKLGEIKAVKGLKAIPIGLAIQPGEEARLLLRHRILQEVRRTRTGFRARVRKIGANASK